MAVDLEKVIGVKCEVLGEGTHNHEKIVRVNKTDFAVPERLIKSLGDKKGEAYIGIARVLSEEGGIYRVKIFSERTDYIHIDVPEEQLVLSS